MKEDIMRCPACPSKTKQRIGNIVNSDSNSCISISLKADKNAITSFETKCPKCGSLIYVNIFWKN